MLAIIPARSGSKGLPDKNIREMCGKPLLAYSIEAALKADIFDTVMVSTDSERYAEIAKAFGAEVPFLRSEETASDKASTRDCIIEVLDKYKTLGKSFDKIMILQPTSPLRTYENIIHSNELYIEKCAKTVISVCKMEHSPLWCNVLPDDLSMEGFISKENDKRRQSLDTYYRINGAIYLHDVKYYRSHEYFYDKNCIAYIMDSKRSIDIDTEWDFINAEMLLKKRGF